MKIQDKRILKLFDKFNAYELYCRIEEIESTEGLSELDWVTRECKWVIEDYEDPTHLLGQDLAESLDAKKQTKNFKNPENFDESELRDGTGRTLLDCKNMIEEYNDTKKLLKALNKLKGE